MINFEKLQLPPWIRKTVGKTIFDYQLIEENDTIAVGISGGKDSWSLLYTLRFFQQVSPVKFNLLPVTVDPGYLGFRVDQIENQLLRFKIPYHILKPDLASLISQKNSPGKNSCAFCARLRRGVLYKFCADNNCSKLALGHHADDAIETLFLSALYEGRLASLPPRLDVTDRQLIVIRPLIRVWESDISSFFKQLELDPVECPFEKPEDQQKRKIVKAMITTFTCNQPNLKKNLLAALQKVQIKHFLDPRWLF